LLEDCSAKQQSFVSMQLIAARLGQRLGFGPAEQDIAVGCAIHLNDLHIEQEPDFRVRDLGARLRPSKPVVA
jgi:hypothetical protein